MSEEILQIDYDQMELIADQFQTQSDVVEQMLQLLNQPFSELHGGGWVGVAADAFFLEYETELQPAIQRLLEALQNGSEATQRIVDVLSQAEEEAANQFTFEGDPNNGGAQNNPAGSDAGAGNNSTPPELNREVTYPNSTQSDGIIPDPIQDAASNLIPDFLEDGIDAITPDDIVPDSIQNAIGDQIDKLPFNNVIEASIVEILRGGDVNLDADALALVRSDEAMQAFEGELINRIQADPRFGNESFTLNDISKGVEFGGQRAPGDMFEQLKDPLNPEYRDTWKVAGNELTWLLRHANVNVDINVSESGEIILNYQLNDVLDLRPSPGRSEEYNLITEIMGTAYHDILGASESTVNGEWQVTYSP